jgi:hypothetical protein
MTSGPLGWSRDAKTRFKTFRSRYPDYPLPAGFLIPGLDRVAEIAWCHSGWRSKRVAPIKFLIKPPLRGLARLLHAKGRAGGAIYPPYNPRQ